MAAVTFDTTQFVKTLEAAGIPVQHAEAFASAVRGDSTASADLVTRKDLQIELQKELAPIKTRTCGDTAGHGRPVHPA